MAGRRRRCTRRGAERDRRRNHRTARKARAAAVRRFDRRYATQCIPAHPRAPEPFPPDGGATRGAARFNERNPQSGYTDMTQDLIPREPEDDDGFSGSLSTALFKGNNYLRWNDTNGWFDRDGLKPPSPPLVLVID